MAEFCLECFNRLNGTDLDEDDVTFEMDLCEGCGQYRPCVLSILQWPRKGNRSSEDKNPSESEEPSLLKMALITLGLASIGGVIGFFLGKLSYYIFP